MKQRKIKSLLILTFLALCLTALKLQAQYVTGDYVSKVAIGRWTSLSTWNVWNGFSLVSATTLPDSSKNVFISSSHVIFVTGGVTVKCKNLTVSTGAYLVDSVSTTANVINTIRVYGSSLVCNGIIGDFPGLGTPQMPYFTFEFEGATCTISGTTGLFKAALIRKTTAFNSITNLIISRNIEIMYASQTSILWTSLNNGNGDYGIYNNAANTRFNVTINPNVTVNVSEGIITIDGGTGEKGGTFTINGTLKSYPLPFTLGTHVKWSTNNLNPVYSCNWVINGCVDANNIISAASNLAGHSVTLNNNALLNVSNWQQVDSINNNYAFNDGSTVKNNIFSAGSHFPSTHEFGQGHLRKYYNFVVEGNLSYEGEFHVRNNLKLLGNGSMQLYSLNGNSFHKIYIGGNLMDSTGITTGVMFCDTLFFNGDSTQEITSAYSNFYGPSIYGNICLQKTVSSSLLLKSPIKTPSVTFLADGYVDLNAHELIITMPFPGAISGFSSNRFIKSEHTGFNSRVSWDIYLTAGTFIIPFGKSSGTLIPVSLITTGNNIGRVTLSTYSTASDNLPWPTTPVNVTNLSGPAGLTPDNRNATVDRYWYMTSTLAMPSGISLTYASSELPAIPYNNQAQIYAQHWDITVGWQQPVGIASGNTVSLSGAIPKGVWTLASQLSPLPVSLVEFSGTARSDGNHLEWITASEVNNNYFELERSDDAENFTVITKINGAGNSNNIIRYNYKDKASETDRKLYYRLKQTDYNGEFSYSKVVVLQSADHPAVTIKVYPNPVTAIISLSMNLSQSGNVTVALYDLSGKLMMSLANEEFPAGWNKLNWNIQDYNNQKMETGIYLLKVIANDFSTVERINVMK